MVKLTRVESAAVISEIVAPVTGCALSVSFNFPLTAPCCALTERDDIIAINKTNLFITPISGLKLAVKRGGAG